MKPAHATRLICLILSLGLLGGCSSYRYMRDTSPKLEEAREGFVRQNPTNRYAEDIQEGRVRLGMNRNEVYMSWGQPDDLILASREGIDETWSYREHDVTRGNSVYRLLFASGRLKHLEVQRGHMDFSKIDPLSKSIPSEDFVPESVQREK